MRCELTDVADAIERTFVARYEGVCAYCDGEIRPGDTIGVDGDREYVCAKCVKQAGRLRTFRR